MSDSKRRRILYIEKPPFVGGSVIGLYETVRGLDKDFYEPVVLFHGPNPYREKFQALGVRVIVLNEQLPAPGAAVSGRDIAATLSRYGRWLGDAYRTAKEAYLLARKDRPLARQVAQLIRAEKIDLVHHNNSLPGNRASIMAAKMAGVPQVCHVRMLHAFGFWERLLARSVKAFIYMSSAIERHYVKLGIPKSQGRVIYDPFDWRVYAGANHAEELRAEFSLTDEDWLISNVGRLDWWKGHDYFVEALGMVIGSYPHVKALIVGEPDATPLSQAYDAKLRRRVAELNLSDKVIFTGFRADIPAIMAASEIVIHSSSEPEPFGRVIVEAMAAGRPVIATAAGGVLDIVRDQETGLLVPPKDVTAMAEAMRQLLQDRDGAQRMGQRARAEVAQRFTIEQHIAAVQQVYEEML